jgi:hypothetical protein
LPENSAGHHQHPLNTCSLLSDQRKQPSLIRRPLDLIFYHNNQTRFSFKTAEQFISFLLFEKGEKIQLLGFFRKEHNSLIIKKG